MHNSLQNEILSTLLSAAPTTAVTGPEGGKYHIDGKPQEGDGI